MKQGTATPLAFAVATALPVVYTAVATPLPASGYLESVLLSLLVFSPFAVMATCLVAIPAYLGLKKFNLVTRWSATGCGAITGAIAFVALTFKFEATAVLEFALLGGAAGLIFWLIWRQGRA